MLATRIRQKEGTFYFIAYNAADLLDKVRFTSRYFFEGEEIAQGKISEHDDVAQFIAGIERSEKGFQRQLNRQKIKQIVNFYETVVAQPMIPGTVLIFTDETLRFQRAGESESVGHLSEPKGKYLIIDGQHRLAGLHFFGRSIPIKSPMSRCRASCLTAVAGTLRPKCSSSLTALTPASIALT